MTIVLPTWSTSPAWRLCVSPTAAVWSWWPRRRRRSSRTGHQHHPHHHML